MVGSWYLHPERHVVEYVVAVALSCIIIRRLLPTLSRYPEAKSDNLMPPIWMKTLTVVIYTSQLAYKINGYPGKILFMLMPCNVLWTIWAALCFLPLETQTMHIMYQLIIPYTSLSLVAVATPDTSDLKVNEHMQRLVVSSHHIYTLILCFSAMICSCIRCGWKYPSSFSSIMRSFCTQFTSCKVVGYLCSLAVMDWFQTS